MLDNHSEARLAEVHPELARRVRTMADFLATDGVEIRVTQGLRSWMQQQGLWLKGRDEHGNVVDQAKVVTKAPPGHSWHQFGLAVDVAPDDTTQAGFQADWNLDHPVWKQIVKVGWVVGLDSGSTWRSFPDWPHFQMPGIPVSPTDEARQLFLDGGMQAVWDHLGLKLPT